MLLRLPHSIHYPITITSITASVNTTVELDDTLFIYSYVTKVKVGQRYSDEETEVDKKFVAEFKSSLEGTVRGWRVWEGDVLTGSVDIADIEEACAHVVQYLGMCTNCGADMTAAKPSAVQDIERATIKTLHDNQFLTISREEASRIDEEAKRRLIKSRRLSLVVDLDQTIIHAAVDPTIADWQKDKDNPNYEAVKDVRGFQLADEAPGMRGCWYYVKLRPGLQEFLEHVAQLYELHIYTMGTRQYAMEIAKIVDPDKRYFGDRILSRDESGSAAVKNLERLFPIDTKMVVIIDDRGDVWKWSANLIRVTPFDFFVGIGDINSAYLPKRQEIQATQNEEPATDGKAHANGEQDSNGAAEGGISAPPDNAVIEQLSTMGASQDPAVLALQSKGQEETISSQLEDKPLLKMQQIQDEQDDKEAEVDVAEVDEAPVAAPTESDAGIPVEPEKSTTPSKAKMRHSILKNDDEELIHLEGRLTSIHTAFFREYDRKRLTGKGGRVSALTGKRKISLMQENDDSALADLQFVPDIKKVMPAMKAKVLSGVTIVFSGVLPLGTDIQHADISTWAKTFGAKITDRISREVTHVIAARIGTAKVKQAVKRGIKVVGTQWLIESMQRWRKLDEGRYLLEGAGQKKPAHAPSSDLGDDHYDKTQLTHQDFMLSSSEGEETSTGMDDTDDDFHKEVVVEGNGQPPHKRTRLEVNVEDVDAKLPTNDAMDDSSPLTLNQDEWADMDAELKEFMGSDVDSESDTDSIASSLSFREKHLPHNKRPREDEAEGPPTAAPGLRPSPRKGGSARRTVRNMASDSDGSLKSGRDNVPDGADVPDDRTIREQQKVEEDDERAHNAAGDDSDDELARELERELEEAEFDDA